MSVDLVSELRLINSFAETRASLATSNVDVVKNMMEGLAKKIRTLPSFALSDALAVCSTMKDCATLISLGFTHIIQTAVDARVANAVDDNKAHSSSRKPQLLIHPHNYLIAQEWKVLEEADLESRKWMLVNRLHSIGLVSLHEQTVKWAVGLLVWSIFHQTKAYPDYKSIFALVHSFKMAHEVRRASVKALDLVVFPRLPKDLPEDVLKSAYKEVVAEAREVEGLADIVAHVPLRQSSKLLREGQGDSKPSHGSDQTSNGMGSALLAFSHALMNFCGTPKHIDSMGQCSVAKPSIAAAEIKDETPNLATPTAPQQNLFALKPVATPQLSWQSSRHAALMANSNWSASAQPSTELLPLANKSQSSKDRKTSEEIEAETLAALQKKTGTQKKKGTQKKNDEKKDPPAQKCFKRPAAAMEKMELVWDPKFQDNRASFTSKHYHQARKQALKKGHSEQAAKTAARDAHAAASELWYKHQK